MQKKGKTQHSTESVFCFSLNGKDITEQVLTGGIYRGFYRVLPGFTGLQWGDFRQCKCSGVWNVKKGEKGWK